MTRLTRAVVLGALALATVPACNYSAPAFICIRAEDCNVGGTCEPAGVCSEADTICRSLRRYAPSAGDLGGQCVPGDPPGSETGEPEPMVGGACEDADDCDDADGFCEPTGWCSYRDDSCETGRRYGRSDDAALQGECIEAAVCGEVIDDKFKDADFDTDLWTVVVSGSVDENWLVEANSRMNYRMESGAEGYLGLRSVSNYDFSAGRIEVDITRAPADATWLDFGIVSTDVMDPRFIYAVLEPDRVFLYAEGSSDAAIDYAETPLLALALEGANVSLQVSADGETFEEILSDRHEFDVANMFPYFEVWTRGALAADETVSIGSVDVCAVQ